MRKPLMWFVGTLLLLSVSYVTSLGSDVSPDPQSGQGLILVKIRDGASMSAQDLVGREDSTIVAGIPQLGVHILAVRSDQQEAAIDRLSRSPSIEYAEPDHPVHAALIPNDPAWSSQWGPQKIQAPSAWDAVTGTENVVIALLDSGADLDHEDLVSQFWTNPGEIPGNHIDDDGNGKIDDIHGWHFYTVLENWQLVSREDSNIQDDYGHGTHVAGVAAARANNAVGIAGVAWGARVMVVKILDEYGSGWYSDIIRGIVYATDGGVSIINLSLGGEDPSQALQDALDYAYDHGVLVVAATGNDGGAVLYPAACEHVLAVAATDLDDQHPSFSNIGPAVDVAAPGVDIYSTWPWRDGYWTKSGTSMAAPHVSGLAALLWSLDPSLTPDLVSGAIARTALDVDAPGWDPYTGWGRIDAAQAVADLTRHNRAYLPIVFKNWPR